MTLDPDPETSLLPANLQGAAMSTSSPSAAGRTFLGRKGTHGLRRAGAVLAAAAALALVAASGGGAAAASESGLARGGMYGEGSNWAGYVIQSGQDIQDVSGEWTVPTLDCQQTPNATDGVWAGIGGAVSGQALLQTGVADTCSNGLQEDQGWWELANAHPPFYFNLAISPGDEMRASVYLSSSDQWVTRIDDLTTGWSGWMTAGGTYGIEQDGSESYSQEGLASNISYAGGSTAEWVIEGPGLAGTGENFQPLADFGTVQFSDLWAGLPSWSLNPLEQNVITYDGQTLAQPGPPDGDGFSVSYTG
jgi:Peptidase A4 family